MQNAEFEKRLCDEELRSKLFIEYVVVVSKDYFVVPPRSDGIKNVACRMENSEFRIQNLIGVFAMRNEEANFYMNLSGTFNR